MNEIKNICLHISKTLGTIQAGTSTRDQFGFLGFLLSRTNKDLVVSHNTLNSGRAYTLEYRAEDCTESEFSGVSICDNSNGRTPDNRWKTRQLSIPEPKRSGVITFNYDYFEKVCRGFDDRDQTQAAVYREAVLDMSREIKILANNILRNLERELLLQFKNLPSAWIDGNTNPQDLVIFTDCGNQPNCAPYAVNPLAGLKRSKDFLKYKLSTANSVFIGNGAGLVFETARATYNTATTSDIQALNTLNNLPELITSPFFDDIFNNGNSSTFQMLEVNPNLIGFEVFSNSLERANAAGKSIRVWDTDALMRAIETLRIGGTLNDLPDDITVPILVPFQTPTGERSILMDLTLKRTGCSQNGWNVSMQLMLNYALDILPATDFICGVNPLYQGITLHQTVLPCEPKQLTATDCSFTPPTALCLKYELPECVSIKKGTVVIGTAGAVIGNASYSIAQDITDAKGLAFLLNNVFANTGIGAFYYDAATGTIKYAPSASSSALVVGSIIVLSSGGSCFNDITIEVIDCPPVGGGGNTIVGAISFDINNVPTGFTADPTNCATATWGYQLIESATGTPDLAFNGFASEAAAFADYLARYTATGYPVGKKLRLDLYGTCIDGSTNWANYALLAQVDFQVV